MISQLPGYTRKRVLAKSIGMQSWAKQVMGNVFQGISSLDNSGVGGYHLMFPAVTTSGPQAYTCICFSHTQ